MNASDEFEKLKESKERYSNILGTAPLGVIEMNLIDCIVTFANRGAEQILGYSADELSYDLMKRIIHPDDLKVLLGNDDEIELEFRLYHKNSQEKWISGKRVNQFVNNKLESVRIWLQDITEKKTLLQNLEKSENNFRNLINNLSDVLFKLSLNGKILYLSPQIHQISGYEEKELLGKNTLDYIHPDDFQKVAEALKSIIQSEEPLSLELRMKHKRGHYVPLFVKGNSVKEGGGIYIYGVQRDITELQEVREELEASENYYRIVFEAIPDLYFLVDQDAKVLKYSGSTKTFVPPEEFLHKSLGEVLPAELGQKTLEVVKKTVSTRKAQSFEYSLPMATGTASYEARFLFYSKNRVGIFVRDITDRKQAEQALKESEEKYRLIAEIANDLVEILNDKFQYEYINEEPHMKLLGYQKDDLLGKSPLEFLHPEYVQRSAEQLKDLLIEGHGRGEGRMRRKEGGYIWLEVTGRVFLDQNDQRKVLLVARDISERKALEYAWKNYMHILEEEVAEKTRKLEREARELQAALSNLRNTQQKLVQSEKLASIGLLSAGIAHDINNPLMGIINYAQIIQDEIEKTKVMDLDKKPFVFLKNIIKEGERISEIVHGLLTFAREDKGNFIKADIGEVIDSTIRLFFPKIKTSLVTLKMDIAHNLPKIYMKPRKIEQVLMNLFQNSLDALNERFSGAVEGQKEIFLQVAAIKKLKRDYVKIMIKDNGQGIKKENLEKIFDPFYSTKQESMEYGVGLGLSISYGIIKDHGGEIEIRSKWNKYTIVTLYLPVKISKSAKK